MEGMFGQIFRVVLALIAVIALMLVLYKYAGKYRLNMKQKETPYGIKKLDMVHLGYKKFVSVVEIRDRIIVVGVGEKELSLLAQWTKEEKEV